MTRYLLHTLQIFRRILKYLLWLLIASAIFFLILIATTYQDLKQIAATGLAGKTYLETAVTAAQKQSWSEALNSSRAAEDKFTDALKSLDKIHRQPIVKKITFLETQLNDLEYLLKTAEILSRSLERSILLIDELNKIRSGAISQNFVDLSPNDKLRFLKLIYESEPELNGLKANLDLAILNLNKIHRLGILWPIYGKISDIKTELNQASSLMAKMIPLTKLLPALAGYPESSHFLLILQNNDELRPTGGFIGVYGVLVSRQGEIISLKTDDSYHLDMPALGKWFLEPPSPIKKYLKVNNWYFRDANWSPDWPNAAQKITEIYQGENQAIGQKNAPLTGVIAITPNLVADLLRLVGPITVRGETYDANNFQPLLQYNVEVAYKEQNISSWNRKEIINDLVAELKTRLFNFPATRWSELLKMIDQNIAAKNIQIYFANNEWQSLIKNLGAAGEVKKTNGDYLMIVDANLGAFKSDAVVKKELDYNLLKNGANLQATLKLTYSHEGGFDWRTTRYRSYTRVLTPLGSRLSSLEGIDEKTSDLSVIDDPVLDKTIFGFFWVIEPSSQATAILKYQLPDKIKTASELNGVYNLYWQKQAGSRAQAKIKLTDGTKQLNLSSDLRTDQTAILNLNR
ncbi:MAG: DUF4012 domain-containing protein [Patescibacteria group bacterium]